MASIIKRKKAYSVVYNYTDENGNTKQKWETWHTHKEALKRKAEIENQQNNGTFLPPNNQKLSDFLYDFVSTYGAKKWGVSMYDSQTALIANYINPIIGDLEVQAINPVSWISTFRPFKRRLLFPGRTAKRERSLSRTKRLKKSLNCFDALLNKLFAGNWSVKILLKTPCFLRRNTRSGIFGTQIRFGSHWTNALIISCISL